jgi:hypothetical protein
MKKYYEQMAQEAIDAISQNISSNATALKKLTEAGKVTIDILESLLGDLKSKNNQIILRLYNNYTQTIPEKDLIRKKKAN